MSPQREKVSVSRLRGISVVAEDDIYDLARLLLKIQLADEQQHPYRRGRATVHGLATKYSSLWNCPREHVLEIFRTHDLPLGAIVEPDEED